MRRRNEQDQQTAPDSNVTTYPEHRCAHPLPPASAQAKQVEPPRSQTELNELFISGADHFPFEEAIRKDLDAGANINAQDERGRTALMYIIHSGNIKAAQLLLQRGANPNLQDHEGKTALMFSLHADEKEPQLAALLLAHKANPNLCNRTGESTYVLTYFWKHRDQSDIRKILRQHGARIGLPEVACEGDTKTLLRLLQKGKATQQEKTIALRIAARRGQEKAVELLLKNGVDANTTDRNGNTLLMQAAGTGDLATVRTLVAHGAKLRARNRFDDDALMLAIRSRHLEAPSVLRYLIQKGADINRRTKEWGWSALHLAASDGNPEAVEVLLQGGADPNAPDARGLPPLTLTTLWEQYDFIILGTEERHAAVVTALLEKGAKPDWQDKNGRSALMEAAARRHPDSVQALLKGGASTALKDNKGRTALTYAGYDGKKSRIVEMLLGAGAKISLIEALILEELELVKRLVADGTDVQGFGPYDQTTLIFAAEKGYVEIVEALLARGVDVNARDSGGYTALYLVRTGRKIVYQSGTTEYKLGGTPKQRERIEKMLLAKGANPDIKPQK